MGSYAIRTRRRSPNTLLGFRKCSLKNCPKSTTWVHLGVMFYAKFDICVKKDASKNASKKGVPPDSNRTLFTGRKAPGEAASRARFSHKKQLFGQQLKHCSKSLQKNMFWIQKTKKWTRCKKYELELIDFSKIMLTVATTTNASIQTSVETIVETNAPSLWSDTPWARPSDFQQKVEPI